MGIVATLHSPNLDLIGAFSAVSLIVAAVAWLVMDLPVLDQVKVKSVYGSLTVITGLLLVSDAPVVMFLPLVIFFHDRYFPNAEDYFGNFVLMAVALVVAYRAFQLNRTIGAIPLVMFGLMILFELAMLVVIQFD